jgi:hypothetical protein
MVERGRGEHVRHSFLRLDGPAAVGPFSFPPLRGASARALISRAISARVSLLFLQARVVRRDAESVRKLGPTHQRQGREAFRRRTEMTECIYLG